MNNKNTYKPIEKLFVFKKELLNKHKPERLMI